MEAYARAGLSLLKDEEGLQRREVEGKEADVRAVKAGGRQMLCLSQLDHTVRRLGGHCGLLNVKFFQPPQRFLQYKAKTCKHTETLQTFCPHTLRHKEM